MNKTFKNKALLSGAAWLALSTILLKFIGLIYKIPLSYTLGDEGMGYFNSAYTVYVFFYVIGTAGIPKAISILVSKKEAESPGDGYGVFRTAFAFFVVLGLFLLTLFIFFAEPLARSVGNINSALAMYAVAPSVLFVCAGGVIRGYLSGKMKFAPIAISELITGVLKLVLGLALARLAIELGKSLPTTAAFAIIGITIGSLVSLVFLMLVSSREKAKAKYCASQRGTISDILKIAVPITLASAVTSAINILDLTIIMNGLKNNGFEQSVANILYGNYTTLAVPMLSLVSTLISPITTAILPILASSYAQQNREEYSSNLSLALTFTSFIAIPSGVVFAVFPQEILTVIFEEGSAVLGAAFLAALAPAVLIIGPLSVINTALEATGKATAAFVSLSLGALVKLIVGVCLLNYTDFGVLSAPIGTSISYVISYALSRIIFAHKSNVRVAILKPIFSPLLASSASSFITLITLKLLDFTRTSRISGMICIVVFGINYLAISLMLSPKLRNTLFKCIKMNKKQINHL